MAPFDRAAAFECAQLDRAALGTNDKKDGLSTSWQKIKIDRQIVATGKAHGASLVISGDGTHPTKRRHPGNRLKCLLITEIRSFRYDPVLTPNDRRREDQAMSKGYE